MFLVFTFSVSILFLITTLQSIVTFDADMADSAAGQVAKGLRGIMAGSTVFIVELFQIFPFVARSSTGLFCLFDGTFFHGKYFFMACFAGKATFFDMNGVIK